MMRSTFSVLFYLKKAKPLKNGEYPIYIRITVNGKRAEISSQCSIENKDWDNKKGLSKRKDKSARRLNESLTEIKHHLFQIKLDLEREDISPTSVNIKNRYLGKDKKEVKLLEYYKEHNEKLHLLIGKGIAQGTVQRHETSAKHVQEFIKQFYGKDDILLNQITPSFIQDYEVYLKSARNCAHNTTVKYIKNLSKIIRSALINGLMTENPFKEITFKLTEVDKPFLDNDELQRLMDLELNIDRLELVRDTFVFCCFTGLAFSDVKALTTEDIHLLGKQYWIKILRQKTKIMCNIPVLPHIQYLIDKYASTVERQDKSLIIPVFSNQKMNAYLKELADLANISKNLTTHVARHTFATTVTLANKVSMESVSKMLGHTNLNMTRKYARILDKTIADEMQNVSAIYS